MLIKWNYVIKYISNLIDCGCLSFYGKFKDAKMHVQDAYINVKINKIFEKVVVIIFSGRIKPLLRFHIIECVHKNMNLHKHP